MAWSESKVFRPFLESVVTNNDAFDLGSGGDTFRAALYDDNITPDANVSAANSAYDAGQWANTNEVFDAGEWAGGGEALSNQAVNTDTDEVSWDADDTASSDSATLADVFGCLVYDDDISDFGVCFNYFGGSNSVTNGTFTIVWHDDGIWAASL